MAPTVFKTAAGASVARVSSILTCFRQKREGGRMGDAPHANPMINTASKACKALRHPDGLPERFTRFLSRKIYDGPPSGRMLPYGPVLMGGLFFYISLKCRNHSRNYVTIAQRNLAEYSR